MLVLKSNAVVSAIDAATADVRAGLGGPVPPSLRDGHYPGAAKLGHAQRYRYPHDAPAGVVTQQYPPQELRERRYYVPTARGAERVLAERAAALRAIVRGEPRPSEPTGERVTQPATEGAAHPAPEGGTQAATEGAAQPVPERATPPASRVEQLAPERANQPAPERVRQPAAESAAPASGRGPNTSG